jgi:hypothetical protein
MNTKLRLACYYFACFLTGFLFFISTTLYVNAQQSSEKPEIKMSVVSWSDIEKYDIDHPVTGQKVIENEFEEEEDGEKIPPPPEVTDFTNVQRDPFGVMLPSVPPAGNNTSMAPIIDFSAIPDNNAFIPPDVNGAAGPNHLMTTLNSQVRIQNFSGSIISTVNLSSFWSSVGNPSTFDPKILYEPFNNRWIITSSANGGAVNSAVLVGVSQTSDPTGSWNLYSIDADATNLSWFDFPSLGFNKDWVVVTGNMFQNTSGNGGATGGKIYIFKKADLYNHVAVPGVTILSPSNSFTLSPAATYDNTISSLYLTQTWNGNSGGNGFIKLYAITGAVGSETINAGVQISTPNPWNGSPPTANFGPQSTTTNKIAENDDRMQNTVYRNGSIWCVHHIFLPTSGVNRCAVQWWKLSTAAAIQQRGRIDDATGTEHYAFPSIAVNSANDALIGYSKFSPSIFPSAAYAFRASTDPVNTFQPEFLYKAGIGAYFKTFSGTSNRWGDYSMTMTDALGTDFWTINEYSASSSNTWGTWWAKVAAPCVHNAVSLTIAANPSNSICGGTTVTFTATPANPGANPVYQWKKNGTVVGVNSSTYSDNALTNGQQISCVLTSDISCATGNPATSNSITMSVGATLTDNNACTIDECNTTTGTVTHTPVQTDDGNACTADACNTSTGVITHSPLTTDDGNACTTDGCDTSTGVFHTALSTDDGNACTTDACNTTTGAISHTAVNTDDGNACTTDGCNTANGVFHTQTCNVYNAYIKNINFIDCKNLEFEIWAEWTGTNTQKFQFFQAGINFNYVGLANGGTLTGAYQLGSADPSLPATQQAPNWNINQTSRQIRLLAAIATPSSTAASIPSPAGFRIGKFKITNTVNFNTGAAPNFTWKFDPGTSTTTKTVMSTYVNGATTAIDVTIAANHAVQSNPSFNYACNASFSTKLFIQGYYTGGGLMSSVLYNIFPGTYVADDCDTITVELHSPVAPYPIFASSKGILKSDGTAVINFPFVQSNEAYYVAIRHRNSVETWSKNPVVMTQNTTYQFSPLQTTAYADNLVETFDQMGWAIYSGDINQDGAIDGSDFLDLDPFVQSGSGGYVVGDINGDGSVDGGDFLMLDPNIQTGVGAVTP